MGEVGGAALMGPIASDSIGGRSDSVSVGGQGAIDGHKDSRSNSLVSAEVLRCPVSPGSEEHPVDRRLNGGAIASAIGWLGLAGVQTPTSHIRVSISPHLSVISDLVLYPDAFICCLAISTRWSSRF
jgi:hypothetical protein